MEASDGLSPRQLELLQYLADDLRQRDAEAKMGLTKEGVRHHTRRIKAKLGCRTISGCVATAIRRGLVD